MVSDRIEFKTCDMLGMCTDRGIGAFFAMTNFLGLYIPFIWVIFDFERWRQDRSLAVSIHPLFTRAKQEREAKG